MKIKVCDSIMGSGKTSSAINMINNDKDGRYIFITPYLDETERIRKQCRGKRFVSPQNLGKGKLNNLHKLLRAGKNVASTHALFGNYNEETVELIRQGGYTLILDEVFGVVDILKYAPDDVKLLKMSGLISTAEDGTIQWVADDYRGAFLPIRTLCKSHRLYICGGQILYWLYPVEVFAAFREAYILTYLFEAQIQKYYCDLNGIEVEYIGTMKTSDGYRFTDIPQRPEFARELKDKIHIVDDERINAAGEERYALSSNWYKNVERDKIKAIKNNLINQFNNRWKVNAEKKMWTTFKDYQSALSGKGYTKAFVPCNARATNDYRDRTHLAYCINVFFNPFLKNYFLDNGIAVKEDEYALSELVQWVWRSAIRDGEDIYIWTGLTSRRWPAGTEMGAYHTTSSMKPTGEICRVWQAGQRICTSALSRATSSMPSNFSV